MTMKKVIKENMDDIICTIGDKLDAICKKNKIDYKGDANQEKMFATFFECLDEWQNTKEIFVLVSIADNNSEYETKPIGVYNSKDEILKYLKTIDPNYEIHEMEHYTYIDTKQGHYAIYTFKQEAE